MDFISSYRLEKDQDGFTANLYLDQNFTEFSNELGKDTINSKKTNENVKDYVTDRYPNKKINTIKVFLGSFLVIKQTNNVATNTIYIGQVLTISTQPNIDLDTISYQVKPGDTLSQIAKRYNTTTNKIKQDQTNQSFIIGYDICDANPSDSISCWSQYYKGANRIF